MKHMSNMKDVANSIKEKLALIPKGELFSFEDFADLCSYKAVQKVIYSLVNSGEITRVYRGIYVVPRFSKLVGEVVPTPIEDIASFIAKKNGWNIVSSGLCCLNYLGLSTQVPATFEYVSDGPSRTYNIDEIPLVFKHTSPSELKNLSSVSQEVVQALKTLGKDNVTEQDISKLRDTLPLETKLILKKECKNVTKWIYDYIREITKDCE